MQIREIPAPALVARREPPPAPAGGYDEEVGERSITLQEILGVLRRHVRLVAACTLACLGLAVFSAMRAPIRYRAIATIRLKDQRKMLTAGLENAAVEGMGGGSFGVDPVLSQIQVLRSRTILGRIVDGQSLRIISPDMKRSLSAIADLQVDDPSFSDTLTAEFDKQGVSVHGGSGRARAPYGQPLTLRGMRFTVRARPSTAKAHLLVIPRDVAIERLLTDLHASLRDKTDVVDLTYEAEDPRLAQQVLASVVDTYQGFNADQAQQESRRRRVFIEEQLRQTDSLLNSAQLALSGFRRGQQAYSPNVKFADEQTGLTALDTRREELLATKQRYASLLTRIGRGDRASLQSLSGVTEVSQSPVLAQLFGQLTRLQASRDSATGGSWGSTTSNPDVQRIDGLIASVHGQIADALQGVLAEMDARVAALDGLRTRVVARIESLPPAAAEEGRLTQQAQTIQGVADQLRQELQRARISEAVEAGQVDIVDRPDIPHEPLPRRRMLIVSFGLLMGLLIGGGSAFLVEQLNTSIRGRDQLEQLLQVPVLAVVPRVGGGTRKVGRNGDAAAQGPGLIRGGALVLPGQTQNMGAEAYRTLRTNLIFSRNLSGMRVMVITSGSPGEGKTTSAANLATVFAHHDLRVLLIDCDLRRPSQHRLFQVEQEPGLSQVVLGYAALEDAVRETGVPGLSLLPAGASPPNPADLLGSAAMQHLLAQARERYDLVLIDTPPVLFASDASILSAGADGVILMVRAGATQRNAARSSYQQLSAVGARVLGTVLNDPDAVVPGYDGYYSGYYSGYHGYYGGSDAQG